MSIRDYCGSAVPFWNSGLPFWSSGVGGPWNIGNTGPCAFRNGTGAHCCRRWS